VDDYPTALASREAAIAVRNTLIDAWPSENNTIEIAVRASRVPGGRL
jgi:hypothetical protein